MKNKLLWLVWQNQLTRKKYHVGNLFYEDGKGYLFHYVEDEKARGLHEAIKNGFSGFFAFPDFDKKYRSKFLFHAFSRRLPNKGRPDYDELLKSYGLNSTAHEMELLKITKGKTATDSFELVSPILLDKDATFKVNFHIEGWRYYNGNEIIDELKQNQKLKLVRDSDIKQDKYAVKVLANRDTLIGYVPAVYSEFFSTLLQQDAEIEMQIETINKTAIPQMKLYVHVSGELPLEFRISYPDLLYPVEQSYEYA